MNAIPMFFMPTIPDPKLKSFAAIPKGKLVEASQLSSSSKVKISPTIRSFHHHYGEHGFLHT